ncbi:MAG: glycerate kinase [Ktedonobacterales bacterium]
MRILVAPQALKGSLDARAVGAAIAMGVRDALPTAEIEIVAVADGGEGSVRALVAATGGELRTSRVSGPLGGQVEAEWGLLGPQDGEGGDGRTAVIEMAAASGLPLVPAHLRNPLIASTRGTGELMRAALDASARRLLIGIGGSATNDGGAGMAQALGARLLDADGHELAPGGAALAALARLDLGVLDPRLRAATVLVACDVNNPLCGPLGASAIFGPQKGASPDMVRQLDAALAHYADVLRRELGADVADVPGAGAAGGLGAGLIAFAGARLVPGARVVLEALDFAARVAGVALVITAEGQLDEQTAFGKAPAAVARIAHDAGAAVIALAGSVAASDDALAALGFDAAVPLAPGPITLEASMARAPELVRAAAARAMRLVLIGRRL